ncbi:unnamed protein product [Blepharisma stoltei]|uniref:Uncharacterized protein n=1 Tax=Blepharisma stoltei TaxID=1481888 RepID=A0AAU9K6Z7_9CILI|nr:unnamed protein product [Blepharisma stoltei]
MDLSYIIDQDIEKLSKLEELGCDLDALLLIAKDSLSLCDELGLNSKQSAEFLVRLKRVYDQNQGIMPEPDLILYENSKNQASRLSVENKVTGNTIFFRLENPQKETFICDVCNEGGLIKTQAKTHVSEKHNTS